MLVAASQDRDSGNAEPKAAAMVSAAGGGGVEPQVVQVGKVSKAHIRTL